MMEGGVKMLAWLIKNTDILAMWVVYGFFVYLAGVVIFKVCHLFDKIYERITKK